jgi:predicted permease
MDEQLDRGLPPDEARYAALRRFGNVTRHLEGFREGSPWFWFETLCQDARYGWRSLLRTPLTTVVATLSLALGIGANTAIYTVARGTLLEPLQLPEVDRVFFVEPDQGPAARLSFEEREQIANLAQSFGVAGLYNVYIWPLRYEQSATHEPLLFASEGAIAALGFQPRLGRWPTPDEHARGVPVIVLSDGVWRRYGADPAILGRQIQVRNRSFTVIGVAPAAYHGIGTGVRHGGIAAQRALEATGGNILGASLIGRLAPGQSWEAAAQQVAAWQLPARGDRPIGRLRLKNAREALVDPARRQRLSRAFLGLGALAVLLLLIGSANLAATMLARAETRRRELAMRISLGASRIRLLRMLSIEFVTLALVSSAAALLISRWMVQAFPAELLLWGRNVFMISPLVLPVDLTASVIVVTIAMSLMTTIVFGGVPAFRATQVSPIAALKAGGTHSSPRARPQQWLLGAQVGAGCVLLVGMFLVAGALRRGMATDLGYGGNVALVFSQLLLSAGDPRDHSRGTRIRERLRERLSQDEGISFAFSASQLAFKSAGVGQMVQVDGVDRAPAAPQPGGTPPLDLFYDHVDPSYRATLGLRLLRGRDLTTSDTEGGEPAVLVNDAFARRFWPEGDAAGSTLRVKLFGNRWLPARGTARVVGVLGDARRDLKGGTAPMIYFGASREEMNSTGTGLYVRTDRDPRQTALWLRQLIREVAPDEPPPLVLTVEEYVAAELTPERSIRRLLAWFSVIAVLLTVIGTYGIAAQAVARRTKEIAVRLALGAPDWTIVQLIARSALIPTTAGIALGLGVGATAATLLESFVFGLEPSHIAPYASAGLVLITVALASSWWPARRAVRTPAAESLRAE